MAGAMRGRVMVGGVRGWLGETSGTCSSARLSHGWEWTDVTEPEVTDVKKSCTGYRHTCTLSMQTHALLQKNTCVYGHRQTRTQAT